MQVQPQPQGKGQGVLQQAMDHVGGWGSREGESGSGVGWAWDQCHIWGPCGGVCRSSQQSPLSGAHLAIRDWSRLPQGGRVGG